MVRVKAKKQKGDDAFKTRKQKVGRKKLAPATATRAEVHARTLHITTAPALTRATAAIAAAAASKDGSSSTRDVQGKSHAASAAASAHSVAELLANARHYRAVVRSSAFAALARLLQQQQQQQQNSHETAVHISALDRLHALSAALEAMTDTEAEVRRGALSVLRELLSSSSSLLQQQRRARGGSSSSSSSAAARTLRDDKDSNNTTRRDGALCATDVMTRERAVAVLHTVYIALTHAMQPVRVDGVELLALLLHACTRDVLHRAIADVCAQQRALVGGVGGSATATTAAAVGNKNDGDGNDDDDGVEAWVVALLRRVSALTLRGKHVDVLASLTEALLPSVSTTASDELHKRNNSNDEDDDDEDDILYSRAAVAQRRTWRRPCRVRELLDEMLPQWGGYWRELMELRLALLRHEDKLAAAIALARVFAAVLTFLTEQQQQQQRGGGGALLLSRRHLHRLQELFVGKVPVTMQEIMQGKGNSNNDSHSSGGRVGGGGSSSRHALALALARVCTPLAHMDEAWRVLQHYFSLVFASTSQGDGAPTTTSSPSARRATTTALLHAVRVFCAVLRLYAPYDGCATRLAGAAERMRNDVGGGDDDDDDASTQHSRSDDTAARATARCLREVCHRTLLQSTHVLQAIARHAHAVAACDSATAGSSDALAELLYSAGEVLHTCALHTRHVRASNNKNSSDARLAHVVAQGVQLVPFLLYSLCKRGVCDSGADGCDVHADRIVRHYMRIVCHMASSRHPLLLLPATPAPPAKPHSSDAVTLADELRGLLRTLFGVRMNGVVREGVLARCSADTTALVRHTLYYLALLSPSSSATDKVQRLRQASLLPVLSSCALDKDTHTAAEGNGDEAAVCRFDDVITLLALHPALAVTASASTVS